MSVLIMALRSIFVVCVLLYFYYFTKRKKHNVSMYMWGLIIVGMASGLLIQLIGVYQRTVQWSAGQISIYLYAIVIIYSIWKLMSIRKSQR